MALIVYGSNLSPFVRKVRVMLAEKGLDYRLEDVNPFAASPEFLEISPMKRIPAFRDTDVAAPNSLCDSSIICDYLEHKHPSPPLYPRDAFARARALWFEEYADTRMAEGLVGALFFERIVKKLLGRETDNAVCDRALEKTLPEVFDYLTKELGARDFLVGNAFTIADITAGTMLVNFQHAGETIDEARWPALAAYAKRVHGRPSFQACIAEESPLIQHLRAA
ncbi:MAG: glutathione S-transferase family protein [Alphaproteobacteria bacterium]|nr:glutathione S-transferase family protein [Alphaproteobacteria bacterium]MBN9593018.1 glutathione S-transferase family protein [Alphaproteobacteria bacterium]